MNADTARLRERQERELSRSQELGNIGAVGGRGEERLPSRADGGGRALDVLPEIRRWR